VLATPIRSPLDFASEFTASCVPSATPDTVKNTRNHFTRYGLAGEEESVRSLVITMFFMFSVHATTIASVARADTPLVVDSFGSDRLVGWRAVGEGWYASGGVLHAATTATEIFWADGLEWTDYVLEVDVRVLAWNSATGLLLRYQPGASVTVWDAKEMRTREKPSPADYAQCVISENGRALQVSTPSDGIMTRTFTFAPGRLYRLRAVARGETITCEVVGEPQTSITLHSATRRGTVALLGRNADFDNVSVTTRDVADDTPPPPQHVSRPQQPSTPTRPANICETSECSVLVRIMKADGEPCPFCPVMFTWSGMGFGTGGDATRQTNARGFVTFKSPVQTLDTIWTIVNRKGLILPLRFNVDTLGGTELTITTPYTGR
jgi:hypothetical protein